MLCISRITNAFRWRDRDVTHADSEAGWEMEREMPQTSFPSTVGRLSRKAIFERHKLEAMPSRRDLFEAMEELCKCTWIGDNKMS